MCSVEDFTRDFCCYRLRFVKRGNFVPNTTIKQAAIVDNLDMNYCKDIDKIILR